MTCHHPIKVWQQTIANLDIPPKDYYNLKKVRFTETPNRKMIEIPCGRCKGCRLDHANMWATRIYMEATEWKKCCFVTLTYNQTNVPTTEEGYMTLKKKHLQDFMKRLRWHEKGNESWEKINPKTGEIEEEYPIRFFASGEYGPKGGRPHYHLAIFNWEPNDLKEYKPNKHGDMIYKSKTLQKIWGKGFVTIEELNYKTACYIARYVTKKAGIEPRLS